MPHISKKELSSKILKQIQHDFKYLLYSEKNRIEIFENLLTETEYIMLAKRLAMVLLLTKDTQQSVIALKIQVSKSTVSRLALDYENGRFDAFKRYLKKNIKNEEELFKSLEKILTLGLPRYASMRDRAEWIHGKKNTYSNKK